MLIPGLVSITFRDLSSKEIIDLCVINGIKSIEWGGDKHVPHGDAQTAETIGKATRAAGLSISAYGSYYKFDDISPNNEMEGPLFEDVLTSAKALHAPVIRVWAGRVATEMADEDWKNALILKSQEMAEQCEAENIQLAFEFHSGTLADSAASVMAVLEAIDRPNVSTYWQPPVGLSTTDCLRELERVKPHLSNLHCFHWGPRGWNDRLPLSDGKEKWQRVTQALEDLNIDQHISLEYVRDDSRSALKEDASTLTDLIQRANELQS